MAGWLFGDAMWRTFFALIAVLASSMDVDQWFDYLSSSLMNPSSILYNSECQAELIGTALIWVQFVAGTKKVKRNFFRDSWNGFIMGAFLSLGK